MNKNDFYNILIITNTIIILLLSVCLFYFYITLNEHIFNSNAIMHKYSELIVQYNELSIKNASLVHELSEIKKQDNSINAFNLLLKYLPYIIGTGCIAYIGLYQITAFNNYIESWELYCSNIIPYSLNNYIYPYIQPSLNILNPNYINNLFMDYTLNLFVSIGLLKDIPTQNIIFDNITSTPVGSNIINSTTIPVDSNIINSTTIPVDSNIINSTTIPVDSIIINSNITSTTVDSNIINSTTIPVDSIIINSTTIPVDSIIINSTTIPIDSNSINSTINAVNTDLININSNNINTPEVQLFLMDIFNSIN